LGWDAVGVVEAVGSGVTLFAPGDRVYYAGAINRPGTNSELHLVDERIVARAPQSLDDAAAAALPLTAITAYELLFDRLRIAKGGGAGQALLVVGGAGGVGSILIQLARQLTQLRIIATASRPETRQWCLDLGAHAVIDHRQPLSAGLNAAGIGHVDFVAALIQTEQHYDQIIPSPWCSPARCASWSGSRANGRASSCPSSRSPTPWSCASSRRAGCSSPPDSSGPVRRTSGRPRSVCCSSGSPRGWSRCTCPRAAICRKGTSWRARSRRIRWRS